MSSEYKKLYRSRDDRMIAGVASGLGKFVGIDPTVMRLLFIFATIWGGLGAITYLIMMVVVPEEPLNDDGDSENEE